MKRVVPPSSDALKATPSQGDVEVAREWCIKTAKEAWESSDDRHAYAITATQVAALIAASRGTRTLTEDQQKYLREALAFADHPRNTPGTSEYIKALVALVERLAGESET